MNYLDKLKEKCDLNNDFMNVVHSIFNKLMEFGYITSRTSRVLERRLYENIDVVLFDADSTHDYKTGYYDAVKKELYIKDISNIESIYLRLMYAMTTTEISKDAFYVGYSTACLSNTSYKIIHKNFGINRAVVSNLVCRLLYTVPTTLSIIPTYRTYENDFLGNKISSDNDIYFLEGKLLSQICFAFDIDEEEFYYHLFTNPKKYLNKFLAKTKLENPENILEIFDTISRKYSNYNKLVYLNKLLNLNYIEIRKNALNNDTKALQKEKKRIQLSIHSTLEKLTSKKIKKDNHFDSNIELSLSGEISSLEEVILKNITTMQNILVNSLIENEMSYATIPYTIKLKTLEKILLVENAALKQQIYNVITYRVLNTFENTASNLIEKMKYSIANEVLSSDKYIKIYKNMKFKRLFNLSYKENTSIAAISVDDSFMQLVEISSLNKQAKSLTDNTTLIHLDSFGYLLNNLSSKHDTDKIEKIYTNMKSEFSELSNISIENVYMTDFDLNFNLIVVTQDNDFKIIKFTENNGNDKYKMVKLSESYSIFNQESSYNNLPIAYKKNMSIPKRMFSFILSIFT
ncbi:MAG: hypothetical protein Q4D02_05445 [Clostridia bacterium]|nr:hypothetical protein [Clostridia bacterium]